MLPAWQAGRRLRDLMAEPELARRLGLLRQAFGVEDGQLPGLMQGREPSAHEIEEGRRLLYVGMTRAKDRLVLTRAEERGGLPSGGERYLREMGLGVGRVS